MTERTLWRLEDVSDATLAQPLRLEQGLRLHLQHTELTTVLMQIGAQQQAYIGLSGCQGCVHGRCLPGCYVELMRRLLRACFDGGALHAVAGGLARRPYRRVALAWPTVRSAPLTEFSLAAWPEAHLIVQWRGAYVQTRCVALLAVGGNGPEPAAALRRAEWRAWALPKALAIRLAASAFPLWLPFASPWPHAPSLLWPQPTALGQCHGGQDSTLGINNIEQTERYSNVFNL
ncbi:MAG TPA: hypothetical protein VFX76_10135 [Roseiflexaceae bacterium]|nr:hypothetical protein [Roseiflexaceae bacterium]